MGGKKAKKFIEIQIAKDAKVNPKGFFKYVNSKIKPKEDISNLKMQDGELTENDTQKAEVLNAFFHSVFTDEDKNDLPIFKKQTDAILSYVNITEKDMQRH